MVPEGSVHNEGIHVDDGRPRLPDDEELLFVGVVAHRGRNHRRRRLKGLFQSCVPFGFNSNRPLAASSITSPEIFVLELASSF